VLLTRLLALPRTPWESDEFQFIARQEPEIGSLLNHFVQEHEGNANLLLCTTEAETAGVVLTAVVREVLRPVGRTRRSLEDIVGHLRVAPQIEMSPDGKISLTLHPAVTSDRWYDVLEDAIGLLERAGERRPAALVLDEFQQVAEIGPQGLGGAFKALADRARGTSLVFAGSHGDRHRI